MFTLGCCLMIIFLSMRMLFFTKRRYTILRTVCSASSGKLAQVGRFSVAFFFSFPEKAVLHHSGRLSSELKDFHDGTLQNIGRSSSELEDSCITTLISHAFRRRKRLQHCLCSQ
jgi:hypothetical protein